MKYAKYKETGISWLPEVPDGWEIRRVKYLLDQVVEPSKSHCKVGLENIESKTGKFVESKAEFEGDGVAFKKGDLLYGKLRPYLAKVWMATFEGNAVGDFIVLRPRVEFDSRFALYYMLSSSFTGICNAATYGAKMPRVSPSFVSSLPLPVPTKEEQVRISEYLDDKCSKVDRLVEAKTKQIELFKELRQSIIAEAVTKGIDGCKTFKPTNIPWLPEVPETWEVRRARYLFKKEQRPTREGDEIVTAFRDGQVTLRKNRRISGFTEATDYSHYQGIRKGDLIIHQMDAFAGCAGVSDSDGMGTPVLSACTPKNSNVDVYFFAHIVRTMGLNGFIQSLARGIRERSADFRFENFARQYLPLPPLAEQKRIVAYLDKKCAKIDTLLAKIEDEVVKLKEYRERLVADVVTGQRKVVK